MDILNGFSYLASNPTALLFVFLAAFSGIIVGALPGLTAAAAIAMVMPITFYLDPLSALAFLYVVGKSGRFGGSIAAILFNTPGTAASAATTLDGYPMATSGKPGKALKMATVASVVGDTIGELTLIIGAVWIASYTVRFGPPEYFAIYLMAFIVIGSVVGKSIIRGIISTLLGAFISLIGLDPITGESRLTMGFLELESGFSLVPLLIGIFVITEVLVQVEAKAASMINTERRAGETDPDANRLTWAEFSRCIPVMLRSTGIGAFIGMLPGLGSSVACFVAYGEEKRRAKNKDEWGTGIVEGIAAPESANNAVSGPSMIPLLTLGVPGSTIAAILVGVFLIHGIQVGPNIFNTSRELVFGLFASGLLGIALYGLIGYFGAPWIGRIVGAVPARLIYPFIFLTAIVAAYSVRSSIFDVGVALAFGIVGYLARRFDFSAPAFIIAFVLAQGAEMALRQSLLLSDNGAMIFIERPISLGFLILAAVVVVARTIGVIRKARQAT
jgi:putative tricarboxylic transport membrane protein